MKLFFFVLFSALLFTSQAQVTGQNELYLLSGVVADSVNNPLNDALVTLYLFTDSTAIASALTAADGGFVINIPNPEKYFLITRYRRRCDIHAIYFADVGIKENQ